MAKGNIRAPRGTADLYGAELEKLECLEHLCANTAKLWGYSGIRTPIFEHTGLFTRSIGEVTDIVEKEMFTIPRQTKKKNQDTFTLRPENTAGVVRAYLENNLHKTQGLTKFSYVGAQFRRERPQKGRLREFNQMGVEVLASDMYLADIEVILLAIEILVQAGLGDRVVLSYNSVGCNRPGCRDSYRSSLKELLSGHKDTLCDDCGKRIDRNVFRVLDCKKPNCRKTCGEVFMRLSTEISSQFCDHCHSQIDFVENQLPLLLPTQLQAEPQRLWSLVRGLDYYTGLVFELSIALGLGTQDAVGGGGRYDGLIEELGGPSLGATGFALGLERILLAQEAAQVQSPDAPAPRGLTYLFPVLSKSSDQDSQGNFFGYGSQGNYELAMQAYKLAVELRRQGLSVEFDLDRHGRKPGNHVKRATRLGAVCAVVLGADEQKAGEANLKVLATREEHRVKQSELVAEIRKVLG